MDTTQKIEIFSPGDIIFHEGDPPTGVYQIIEGTVEVIRILNGETSLIGEVKDGDFLGEMGVIEGTARNASARAKTRVQAISIGRTEFLETLGHNPKLCLNVIHLLSARTRSLQRFLDDTLPFETPRTFWFRTVVSILSRLRRPRTQLTFDDLPDLAARPINKSFSRGMYLACQGSNATHCFLIREGEVEIKADVGLRRITMGTLTAGEWFGEMGVLENLPRTAHGIVISSHASIDIYTAQSFTQKIENDLHLRMAVLSALSSRVKDLNKLVTERLLSQSLDPALHSEGRQLVTALGGIYSATSERLDRDLARLRQHLMHEKGHFLDMMAIYQKRLTGEVTEEELERANQELTYYLKALGLGTLLVLPGSVVTVPVLVKLARSAGIELLPSRKNLIMDETEAPVHQDVLP